MTPSTSTSIGPPPTELRDKIAQLLFVRIGSNLAPVRTVEEDAARVEQLMSDCPIGGLCLFNGRWPLTRDTLAHLQSVSRFPLLVGSDLERGAGQQLHGLTVFPHAMAFGQLGEKSAGLVEQFAEYTAREARACGVHVNFGPVADVNSDPRNPIIATRSFGTEARQVAELAVAFVRGTQRVGVLATPKHFPGHGNTHEDSHESLPSVMVSREELEACDLLPFRAAIDAGAACVLTAHVRYPSLDPSGEPATLSRRILRDLLRDDMGFEGLVITDSMLMSGVKDRHENETELALAALAAGADVLLDKAEPRSTLDGLCRAVEQGRLSEERIDESVARLWKAKERVMAGQEPANVLPIPRGPARALAEQVARHAFQWSGDSANLLPFDPHQQLTALLLRPFETYLDQREAVFAAELRERFPQLQFHELGPQAGPAEFDAAWQAAESSQQVVAAMVVKPAAWHRFGLLPEQAEFLVRLSAARPIVLACLGTPVALSEFDRAAAKVCAFSDVAASQRALANCLLDQKT